MYQTPTSRHSFFSINNINNNDDIIPAPAVPPAGGLIKLMLWNIHSIDHVKKTFLRSRYEDIIVLNETWLKEDQTIEIKGYNCIIKNREL